MPLSVKTVWIAYAAHKVGLAVAGQSETNSGAFVAAKKHLTEIAMVGLVRLRYRPHTAATAAWLSQMVDWDALAATFDAEAETYSEDKRRRKSA
jgi:hypothetical protein